jgi:hypothetical protein
VVASFGAAAAALIAGVQLTSIGEVSGWRLVGSFASAAVAFGAVCAIIFAAVRVLVPEGGTYNDFADGQDFQSLRDYLATDDSPLRNQARDANDLAAKYTQALEAEHSAWNACQKNPSDQQALQNYRDAQADRQSLFSVVRTLTSLGLFLRTKKLFGEAMHVMYIGVAIAAAGAVSYAYLANPPSATPSRSITSRTVTITTSGPTRTTVTTTTTRSSP